MNEVTFDTEDTPWKYAGRTKDGKPKFRKYTGQSLEHVKAYLDSLGISYLVEERVAMMFIYKQKEPKSRYSPRYAYYYTTGRWGGGGRSKHYHSDGIETFIEKYFTPVGWLLDE
jgi:hypothetical protein